MSAPNKRLLPAADPAAPARPQFEPYNPNDPRIVRSLHVAPSTAPRAGGDVHHFAVTYYSATGEKIGETQRAFEVRQHSDVVDVIAYFLDDRGRPQLAVIDQLRPAVAARALLGAPSEPTESGVMTNLPGGYIGLSGERHGINATVGAILRDKLGLPVTDIRTEHIGGSYFPSVGGSIERAFPVAVQIPRPTELDRVKFGGGFEAMQRVRFLDPQAIVDGYVEGAIRDTRLVVAAFRLADRCGIVLESPVQLPRHSTPTGPAGSGPVPVLSREEVRALRALPPAVPSTPAHVDIRSIPTPATPGYLDAVGVTVTPHAIGDATPLAPFEATVIRRRTFDSVDIGAYAFTDSMPCILMKRGIRESVVVRDRLPHPIGTRTPVHHIEGIAESFEVSDYSAAGVLQRALAGLIEEGATPPVGAPTLIGRSYPSPGLNPECAWQVLVEVDPSQSSASRGVGSTVEEVTDRFFVRADDIIALGETGEILDPRLLLHAYLLRSAFTPYGSHLEPDAAARAERNEFVELINVGSPIEAALSQWAPEVNARLNQIPEYRKLKVLCDRLGVDIIARPEPGDSGVFEGFVPRFQLPDITGDRLPFHLLHDLRHYSLGGVVPFERSSTGEFLLDDTGKPVLMSFDRFRKAVSLLECEAVWFSDVVIPNRYGRDALEKLFGGKSVAGAFAALGIPEDEARYIIRDIERDGVLPERLLRHPRYAEYRDVFEDRLLRFHIMDTLQLEKLYDFWRHNPRVAREAVRFFERTHSDPTAYFEAVERSLIELRHLPEGNNPFQATVAKAINTDVRTTALQLAFYAQQVETTGRPRAADAISAITAQLEALKSAEVQLVQIRDQIQSVDPTAANLRLFRRYRSIMTQSVGPSVAFARAMAHDERYLDAAAIARNSGRIFPFLQNIDVERDTFLWRKVRDHAERCYQRFGVPFTPSERMGLE
jgi:hypothetical protein